MGEKKHEDEASYMAASERKLTHKQQPEEVLMNLSREDQRKIDMNGLKQNALEHTHSWCGLEFR